MNKIILILLIIVSQFSFAQNEKLTQKKITRLFKEDKNNNYKDWFSCNLDNTFYKSDTIYLYDNVDYFLEDWKCKKFIRFRFNTKKSFSQCEYAFYGSISTVSEITKKDLYKMKVTTENDSIFINKYFNNELVVKFYVKELSEFQLTDAKYKSKKLILIKIH